MVAMVVLNLIFNCTLAATENLASTTETTGPHNENRETTVTGDDVDTNKDFEKFLMACSQGDIDTVKEFVQKDTKYYVTAYSQNGGESCLHVAGILGQATVTQYILQQGGNPNQRSQNIPQGLRMTPLSWNVYGNHIENVQLLLKAGADVNLDFDYVVNGTIQKVTVFDLLLYIHSNINLMNENEPTTDETAADNNNDTEGNEEISYEKTVRAMRDLLLQYDAKRHTDVQVDRIESDAIHNNNNNINNNANIEL